MNKGLTTLMLALVVAGCNEYPKKVEWNDDQIIALSRSCTNLAKCMGKPYADIVNESNDERRRFTCRIGDKPEYGVFFRTISVQGSWAEKVYHPFDQMIRVCEIATKTGDYSDQAVEERKEELEHAQKFLDEIEEEKRKNLKEWEERQKQNRKILEDIGKKTKVEQKDSKGLFSHIGKFLGRVGRFIYRMVGFSSESHTPEDSIVKTNHKRSRADEGFRRGKGPPKTYKEAESRYGTINKTTWRLPRPKDHIVELVELPYQIMQAEYAVWMNKDAVISFRTIVYELNARGLLDEMDRFMGCYNPRPIAGTRRASAHAFGLACDFYGNKPGRHFSDQFVEVWEHYGWCWGGRFSGSRFDPIHFSYSWEC